MPLWINSASSPLHLCAPEQTQQGIPPFALPNIALLKAPPFCYRADRIGATETHIIPDALYGIEYSVEGAKRARFRALACARTTLAFRSGITASSRKRKRIGCEAIIKDQIYKKHGSIPNLDVRFIDRKARS